MNVKRIQNNYYISFNDQYYPHNAMVYSHHNDLDHCKRTINNMAMTIQVIPADKYKRSVCQYTLNTTS